MNTEPWVTAIEVAQHLGVVKDAVYRWRGQSPTSTPHWPAVVIPAVGSQ
jgi:hypothetical protein